MSVTKIMPLASVLVFWRKSAGACAPGPLRTGRVCLRRFAVERTS